MSEKKGKIYLVGVFEEGEGEFALLRIEISFLQGKTKKTAGGESGGKRVKSIFRVGSGQGPGKWLCK